MLRHTLVVLTGLLLVSPAGAAAWADAMFEELSKDFGSVPRGSTLTHPFRLTNNTGQTVQIASIRVSCGCVSAMALQGQIPPGGSTVVLAQMDTSRFSGIKNVTIYVQFSQPRFDEVRLWVQANSRDDLTVTPDSLAFGQIKRGSAPSASVTVTFRGNNQAQILGASCESNYVQAKVRELRRDVIEVSYEVTAQLRADAPVGKWYTDVWLTTNNAASPKIRIPLTVEIESALTVSPPTVLLGKVKIGSSVERRVIVRGVRPFKIVDVKGTDELLTAQPSSDEPRTVHVLTVALKGNKVGELTKTLKVVTDLPEESEIEFQAKAEVVP
ncbi:MAG: DUF1573 domain-containing protein [Gemmataceae bacterium]|nr:DUF1573 domain-containing protein [Gemmataceae bacterium]MDW8265572.1 DUF1573 domain-containing protein [Gemmataceae bacterium]